MRGITISIAAALAACSLGQSVNVPQSQGVGVDSLWNKDYSTSHEMMISGKVTGKIKGTPNGMAEGMTIFVTTKAGKSYAVDMGPTWYLTAQSTHILIGDKVRIRGEDLTFVHNHQEMFLPRLIFKGHEILSMRDTAGRPYWTEFQKGRVAVDGSDNTVTGTVVGESEADVDAEKQKEMTYQLQTANGLINVAAAPSWYMQQTGMGFKVGDNVTVYTGLGPVNYGPNILLANGIYGTSGTMVLRPGGIPVWNGYANSVISQ
jgi:hypothetical protein